MMINLINSHSARLRGTLIRFREFVLHLNPKSPKLPDVPKSTDHAITRKTNF